MSGEKMGMRIGESVFCICYLLFDLIAGIVFLTRGSEHLFLLYGLMTLLLGCGDAFHLVPRVVKHIRGESPEVTWWMNLGLAVTSVTMTVFYIILYYIWADRKGAGAGNGIVPALIWITALVRIAVCLLPQNNWFQEGNKKLSLCRNFVFAIMGAIEAVLFFSLGGVYGTAMALCIVLSFLCYLPVTLFARENPGIGMLMIPKTVMYIIMICLGLALM